MPLHGKLTITPELIKFKHGPSYIVGPFILVVGCGASYLLSIAPGTQLGVLIFGYLISSIFVLLGFSATFCSASTEINTRQMEASLTWRVFGLKRKRKVAPIGSFDSVEISTRTESQGEDEPSKRVYLVSLHHTGEHSRDTRFGRLNFFEFGKYDSLKEANEVANTISERTRLKVKDETRN